MDTRKTVATTSTVNSKVMPLHSVSMILFHLLTLLYIFCHDASGEVYYIKPSTNSPCISEYCLTLSHFADNSSRFLNADTTMILLSGSHNLESELLISNVSKIRMYSLSSNMTTINCEKHARISFVAVDHVYISGFKYNKCRGHYVRSVHSFSLKNCTFRNNTEGAIDIMNSTAHILQTFFILNSLSMSLGAQKYKTYGAAIMASQSSLMIVDSTFKQNGAGTTKGGAIYCKMCSNITVIDSTFVSNYIGTSNSAYFQLGCSEAGGVFAVDKSVLYIRDSYFAMNKAKEGGVICADTDSEVIIDSSEFINNSASNAGGVLAVVWRNVQITITYSIFTNNRAERGGIIDVFLETADSRSTVCYINVIASRLKNNTADDGGVLSVATDTIIATFRDSVFVQNTAANRGGIMLAQQSNIYFTGCLFTRNAADTGGVLYIGDKSVVSFKNVKIHSNTANQGIMYFIDSNSVFAYDVNISNNFGSVLLYHSNATFKGRLFFFNCTYASNKSNGTLQEGGALTAFQTTIIFEGTSIMMYNHAMNGGAIHAIASKLIFYGRMMISNNTAKNNGGGIYVYQSELNCKLPSSLRFIGNCATKKGGGIHSISSIVTAEYELLFEESSKSKSRLEFVENNAGIAGGGICLEVNAKIDIFILSEWDSVQKQHTLTFTGNSANYGGAVYVADSTNSGICASTSYKTYSATAECFIQVKTLQRVGESPFKNLVFSTFVNNIAKVRGSNLFGGLLDRCTLGPFIKQKRKQSQIIDGLTYFTAVSNINDLNTITSGPVQVCFCSNSQPDCSYQLPPIQVKKGELFTVPLVAVDHAKQVISATILSSLKRNESGIGEGQLMQSTGKNCTDLIYNIYSKHDSEELVVYADGPCKDAELSRGRIQVIFSDCNCPVAFQPNPTELTRCVCVCDSKLDKYITDCDSTTKTFTRNGKFWISHINTTVTGSMVDYQYLIYPYCPLDYCQPSSSNIKVNLDIPGGVDIQCANGRSGLLCGTCKPGLTLSLGSSHCIACPSYWPALLTTIFASFFLMGIGLVFLIFALNLTVAVGTLNGIIFYVNIINANSSSFLIFKKPNIVSIFISLLNLELGVDVCLFKGMDAYWKTLLQLAFPVYLIFLVVMIILVSERSTKFARLLGKKNPVATLGTLILLSYAKLLHLIIASLSFAVLHYPNNSYEVVWLPDATVGYLRGKHVILFLIALLILLAGIAYTVLLFSWQWLLRVQSKKLLRWVRYHRLYIFLEPYHAPYTFKHRYWTGLLLLIRAMLYIISAANVSSDPAVNLLAIGITMIGLLLLKGYSQGRRIYMKWPLDLLEMAIYINLSLVNLFSLEGNRNQTVSVYISGSFALALFVFILAYHIFQEFLCKTRLWKALKQKSHEVHQEDREEHEIELIQPVVTHTEVTGPKRNETSLSASVRTTEGHYKIEGLHNCSEPVNAPEVHPKMSLPYRLMKSK